MWKYYSFKIAGATLAYLPWRIGYLAARLVADLVYLLSPPMRAAISDNMRHVLGPQTEESRVQQAVRAVLRNAARNYFDLIKMPHLRLADVASRLSVNGWHHLQDALERGNGVIIVTAHLGSFDMAAQVFAARAVRTTIPVEPLQPPRLLAHVTALRASNGVSFVPAQAGILRVLTQSLQRGEAVLLACDRDIGNNGSKAEFFGQETVLPTTAVRLAMRTGAAVVPGFTLRRVDGRYDVYFEPAIRMVPAGRDATSQNLEQVARIMQKYIQSNPEQWVVLSRFWPRPR